MQHRRLGTPPPPKSVPSLASALVNRLESIMATNGRYGNVHGCNTVELSLAW